MSQQNEDSIERFFRKAVVQQDKTFMERDWASMEKMLDEQALLNASQKKGNAKSLIATAVAITALIFLFVADSRNDIPEDSVQMQAAVGVLGPHRGGKTEGPTADLHSSDKKSDEEIENSASPKNSPGSPIAKSRVLGQNPVRVEIDSRNTQAGAFSSIDGKNNSNVVTHATGESPSGIVKDTERSLVADEDLSQHVATSMESLADDSTIMKTLVEQPVAAESVEEAKEEERGSERTIPRFNVTALVSPDFSTTSLSKYSRPSNVFGVLIGYRVLNRLTVMTGATKSLKRYEGYGQDYSPPEGYWRARTNGVVPDEVEGKCGIIEVPILLQFDVMQKTKNRLFISVGVSSYFMRSEHYQYTFNDPNPGAANSWTAKEPTRYLFKIGHLSAGYDHMIAKKFTIGIEPFLKVPFEGIGWTDINLYSTGAYINLRYNILSTRHE